MLKLSMMVMFLLLGIIPCAMSSIIVNGEGVGERYTLSQLVHVEAMVYIETERLTDGAARDEPGRIIRPLSGLLKHSRGQNIGYAMDADSSVMAGVITESEVATFLCVVGIGLLLFRRILSHVLAPNSSDKQDWPVAADQLTSSELFSEQNRTEWHWEEWSQRACKNQHLILFQVPVQRR